MTMSGGLTHPSPEHWDILLMLFHTISMRLVNAIMKH